MATVPVIHAERTTQANPPTPADEPPGAGSELQTADDALAGDAAELAAQLRPALLRLTRLIRNQRADMSITLTLVATLMTLERLGEMSATELAACERIQPPSMTSILAKLEAGGLVTRSPHPSDRRQAVVAITDAGRDLIARERNARTAWLSTRLELLDRSERAVLQQSLAVLERLATL